MFVRSLTSCMSDARKLREAMLAILLGSSHGLVLPPTPRAAPAASTACSSRRDALLGALAACTAAAGVRPASAFSNAIPDYANYADKPKRKGDPPKDLGVQKRTINADSINADPLTFNGLRKCDGKPNCFSTTGDELLEDRILTGVDTLIKPWKPPPGDGAPFKSLVKAVKAYTPGQGFIDGGGFQVVKESDAYIYVQFEALKKGYIDVSRSPLSRTLTLLATCRLEVAPGAEPGPETRTPSASCCSR